MMMLQGILRRNFGRICALLFDVFWDSGSSQASVFPKRDHSLVKNNQIGLNSVHQPESNPDFTP